MPHVGNAASVDADAGSVRDVTTILDVPVLAPAICNILFAAEIER